ncbi:MAG: hypothetical protein JW776_05020 [Candidatus Lokiarchaeota archaeon]|nr:hypothetical protein [Candidatus Lokiarchaeota archaeon]
MANKIGILNGILLIILNFFAVIPVGIYFAVGITSFTGIPLAFAHNGSIAVYAWGVVDIALSSGNWWLTLGVAGISGFILELLLIVGCILTFIGSWIQGVGGRKLLGISLIMEIVCFLFITVDILAIGTLGITISFSQIFIGIGIGIYLLVIIILLQVIAVRIHNMVT